MHRRREHMLLFLELKQSDAQQWSSRKVEGLFLFFQQPALQFLLSQLRVEI